MKNLLLPARQPIVEDTGAPTLLFIEFLQNLSQGDPGNKFSPDVENLGTVGTPTITGVYYENNGFVDFYARITPGTNTTSTAGTTYIQLPFTVTSDCPCFATSGSASTVGSILAASNRAYLPGWSALTSPVTISGRVATQ